MDVAFHHGSNGYSARVRRETNDGEFGETTDTNIPLGGKASSGGPKGQDGNTIDYSIIIQKKY